MADAQPTLLHRLAGSRPLLWGLLALPGAWMLLRYLSGAASYGEIVSDTGELATQLLIVTLAITPLRLVFRRGAWLVWLVRRRRDLGVATFGYAAGHLGVYLVRKGSAALIIEEAADPWLLAGWAGLVILLAMALTSNDLSVRAMRRWWKRLHRLVYLATALVFVHWTLSAFDPGEAYLYLALVVVLELVRIMLQWRQRVT